MRDERVNFSNCSINVLVSVSGARYSKWRKRSEQVQCSSAFGGEISCCWFNSRRRTKSGAAVWGSCGNLGAAERKRQHEMCYKGLQQDDHVFLKDVPREISWFTVCANLNVKVATRKLLQTVFTKVNYKPWKSAISWIDILCLKLDLCSRSIPLC